MKITKELVFSLGDENIKKKDYDDILEAIAEKVNIIWREICKLSGRKVVWWAFSNDVDLGKGNGSTGGDFDLKNDSEWIEIIGEYGYHENPLYEYECGFPTEFLWIDNWRDIVTFHLNEIERLKIEKVEKKEKKSKTTFTPKIKTIGIFMPGIVFTINDIKNETMFFSCSPSFVRENKLTSPITNLILEKLFEIEKSLKKEKNIVIDTRVNMLMKGQWPSIPGFHCDDVPRNPESGQPDLSLCDDSVRHFMVLVSTNKADTISGTEFVTNERTYNLKKDSVWNSLDSAVCGDKKKKTRFIKEREIIEFNQLAIHRATPAKENGWRLFFRLSVTHRKPVNEIRNQVQIYVDPKNSGW